MPLVVSGSVSSQYSTAADIQELSRAALTNQTPSHKMTIDPFRFAFLKCCLGSTMQKVDKYIGLLPRNHV